ncbi:MAG: hypothetical protein ACOCX0_03145, partial [Bacteroidota bacterium]
MHCLLTGWIYPKSDDDLVFLSIVQKEGEDYGYHEFVETVETVILGRKTYDWMLGHGYDFPLCNCTTGALNHLTCWGCFTRKPDAEATTI